MSDHVEEILRLIDICSPEEKGEVMKHLRRFCALHPIESDWNTTAEAILTAIGRSGDLTQRGIRGILAEATFESVVVPDFKKLGWESQPIQGDQAYDFLIQRSDRSVSIQVKLQRREKGAPKGYSKRARAKLACPAELELYVVEVQKTRSGERNGKKTRPYRFGDFDVLAVNLHPATGDWSAFVYTPGYWLIPRDGDEDLIEIMQPVALESDGAWTRDLNVCIDWPLAGEKRTIYR